MDYSINFAKHVTRGEIKKIAGDLDDHGFRIKFGEQIRESSVGYSLTLIRNRPQGAEFKVYYTDYNDFSFYGTADDPGIGSSLNGDYKWQNFLINKFGQKYSDKLIEFLKTDTYAAAYINLDESITEIQALTERCKINKSSGQKLINQNIDF